MTDYALPALIDFLEPVDRALLESLGLRRSYTDGELIQRRGDPDAAMQIVIAGAVRLSRVTADGRHITTLTATPGQHYADNTAFLKSKRTHHAVAVGDTIVDSYPHDVFVKLLEIPAIVKALYTINLVRLDRVIELFDDIRSLSPDVRLAKVLSSIRMSSGGAKRLECSQEDLASLLGVSAMTLSKSIKVLKQAGLIDTGYRTVTIIDHLRFDAWLADHTED